MNIQKLKTELAKNKIIKHLLYFDSVSSTNDYAKKNYKKLKHGTVILADEQTKGRGRFENKWFSPKDKGLYFSVLLKPRRGMPSFGGLRTSWHAPTIELLNLIPAYAVLKAIMETMRSGLTHPAQRHPSTVLRTSGLTPHIKYPNDILINNKKIGGVLVETKFKGKKLEYAVMGVGLNISGKSSDFPTEIRKTSAFISQFVNNVGDAYMRPLQINIIKNLEQLI